MMKIEREVKIMRIDVIVNLDHREFPDGSFANFMLWEGVAAVIGGEPWFGTLRRLAQEGRRIGLHWNGRGLRAYGVASGLFLEDHFAGDRILKTKLKNFVVLPEGEEIWEGHISPQAVWRPSKPIEVPDLVTA
jgi:hypothetical protein